jgi:uncharacterized protein
MAEAWRSSLQNYLREQARPVEKYGHQPRLYELTLRIGRALAYDDDVIFAAVWLHDLGVFTGHRPEDLEALQLWDNSAYAIEHTPPLLARFGFPQVKIPAVLACIQHHQPSGDPRTIEATILRDADILEQLGAVGILRTVAKIGRDTRFHTFTDAIESLRKAHERLPGLLRLDSAKALATERIQVFQTFLAATATEAGEHLH